MHAARRHALSTALALVALVGLPVANAAAALRDKAPAPKGKAKKPATTTAAKAPAKKPAATTSAAAKTAAAKTTAKPAATTTAPKPAAATTAPKPAATTTAPRPAATTSASGVTTTPAGVVVGPGLDTLPEGDPHVKLPAGDHTVVGDTFEVGSWGPVTVTIVVTNGRIVAASAELPMERPRSRQLNEHVGLWLNQRAVDNQAARLEIIAGATQTCSGYQFSLQSAIDKAGLGR